MLDANGTRESRDGTTKEGGRLIGEGTSDGETGVVRKRRAGFGNGKGIVGKADLLWQNAVAQRSVGA